MDNTALIPIKCGGCGKIVAEADAGATVRVKCPKCGTWSIIQIADKKPEPRNFNQRMDEITKKRASA